MDHKQMEAIGIDLARGGRVQVIAGELTSVRESTNKDTHEVTLYADLVYFGGTDSLRLPPDHPIKDIAVGTEIIIAYSWTDTKWGPRAHDVTLINAPKRAS